jgi:hypothetical protein
VGGKTQKTGSIIENQEETSQLNHRPVNPEKLKSGFYFVAKFALNALTFLSGSSPACANRINREQNQRKESSVLLVRQSVAITVDNNKGTC